MKALIFNSGIGKRMGHLTEARPKCMVELYSGETIFERQIRLLQEAGIKEIVVTTGPYEDQLRRIVNLPCFSNLKFTLVNNPLFDKTNYIYSMYLAREYLDDDFITMHGDLVFDRGLVPSVLKNKNKSLGLINKHVPLPEKDFKARVVNGNIHEVGINIFDSNCYAFQPLYKFDKETLSKWIKEVEKFIDEGNNKVYAENALKVIAPSLEIKAVDIGKHFINEIDNEIDLHNVSTAIEQFDYQYQVTYTGRFHKSQFKKLISDINIHHPLVVASDALISNPVFKNMIGCFENHTLFFDFEPNPKYESMLRGLNLFKEKGCDSIISFGGGSAIDVAKNIKLCASKIDNGNPLIKEAYVHNRIRHICFPSTCGTGSESTQHSVLYLDGVKQSIKDSASLPEYVYLLPELIIGLPLYQKKVTSLDAFSQCVESLWAKNGNKVSRAYATKGIRLFLSCYKDFLKEDEKAIKDMQVVANLSGKAINIGSTTAAHALSYAITSSCHLPHGHAVACCLKQILPIFIYKKKSINKRLLKTFRVNNEKELLKVFDNIFNDYELDYSVKVDSKKEVIKYCLASVNPERLSNFPFFFPTSLLCTIYNRIIL